MGFTPSKTGDDAKIFENSMKMFSPEFQGRIDSIVHFNSLTNVDALAIVDKLTQELNDEIYIENSLYTDISLLLTENCKQFIITKGFSPEKGARELNRTFKRLIDAPLGRIISQNDEMNDFPQYKVKILADEVNGHIEFSINPKDIEEIKTEVKDKVVLLLANNFPKIDK
jgi:ATP-dependent Clp protease ATP-binding subunit ClpA